MYFLCLLLLPPTTTPPLPSLLAIGFRAVPFGRTSDGCQAIRLCRLWTPINILLMMEETDPKRECRASHPVLKTVGNTNTSHTNIPRVGRSSATACTNKKAVVGTSISRSTETLRTKIVRDGRRASATMILPFAYLQGCGWR